MVGKQKYCSVDCEWDISGAREQKTSRNREQAAFKQRVAFQRFPTLLAQRLQRPGVTTERNSNNRYLFCLGFLTLHIDYISSFTDSSRSVQGNATAFWQFTCPVVPAAVTGPREPERAEPCLSKTVSAFEHRDVQIANGLKNLFLPPSVIKEQPAPLAWETGQNALNLGISSVFFSYFHCT